MQSLATRMSEPAQAANLRPRVLSRAEPLLSALQRAERLAEQHRNLTAVVYRKVLDKDQHDPRFLVRLSDEPAPTRAEVFTTVTRRSIAELGPGPTVGLAVRQVLANLPNGVTLSNHALVEHYPKRARWPGDTDGAYGLQFMSLENLNVASWIPGVQVDGVQMHLGSEGRGRRWSSGSEADIATMSIARFIAEASQR